MLPAVDGRNIKALEENESYILFHGTGGNLFVMQQSEQESRDVSSVRQVIYGASPIAEDLLVNAQKTFKCDFVQVYGLTETTGCATHLPAADHAQERGKLRSCGKPNTGVEIKIVDENDREVPVGQVGEILIKAASNMKGYWNNPDATNGAVKDGWFYSGDAGYADDEGYIFIHDRVKDMIVSGGENVYPAEVRTRYFRIPTLPMLPLLAYRMKNGARR